MPTCQIARGLIPYHSIKRNTSDSLSFSVSTASMISNSIPPLRSAIPQPISVPYEALPLSALQRKRGIRTISLLRRRCQIKKPHRSRERGSTVNSDFSLLMSNWQLTGPALQGDLNQDGGVDANDLAIFTDYWLSFCEE